MKKGGKIILFIVAVILLEVVFIYLELNLFNKDKKIDTESTSVSESEVSSEIYDVSSKEEEEKTVSSEPEKEVDLNQYAVVTVKSAVLRSKGSKNSTKIGNLSKDEKVTVIETSGSWCKVSSNEKTGWVSSSCIELIRNRDLEAKIYSPLPDAVDGKTVSLKDTATQIYFEKIAEKYHATAADVAIIKDGKVAYTMDYGYADLKNKVLANEDTKYRIASLSKVFVAMNAMTLVDSGEISLDEDITNVSGYYTRNPYHPNDLITMRMLLTHTSTLMDGEKAFTAFPWARLNNRKYYMSYKPGSHFTYSNFAMGYAAASVEVKSNMLISEYAHKAFLDGMGIDASFDGSKIQNKDLVANLYNGKSVKRSVKQLTAPVTETTPGKTFHLGAGGLIISAKDYAKLMTVLINDGMYDGKEYLSKKAVDEMLTPQFSTENFEQCLAIRYQKGHFGNRSVYYHTGDVYGMHSVVVFDKTDKSGVVVLTSGASGVRDDINVYKVCEEIVHLCYDDVLGGY